MGDTPGTGFDETFNDTGIIGANRLHEQVSQERVSPQISFLDPLFNRPDSGRDTIFRAHLRCFRLLFERFRERNQELRCTRIAIEDNILDRFEQNGINFLVGNQQSGIHNSHVQPGGNRMVQEHRMHRLPHNVVSPEGKRNIRNTTAGPASRTTALHLPNRVDKVERVG
ncbi:MAG: hypothetical protein BWY82_01207 [Verrucomicrobia bacterium ADurb.Bin474]|nr:MAG: hypothetical protein BWY82_01207 [Verrucomicrobia bacterium ADurb.Bin474]